MSRCFIEVEEWGKHGSLPEAAFYYKKWWVPVGDVKEPDIKAMEGVLLDVVRGLYAITISPAEAVQLLLAAALGDTE